MRDTMTFGERFVRLLMQEQVDTIFSQGDLSMVDIQMHAERNGITVVGPRHEASAVFMASGYYCMTGRPQVAFGAIGPGVANLLPGAVCAAQENIPVLLMGARRQNASNLAVRRGRWLHAPMLDMFRSTCKFAAAIDHPDRIDEVVQEAFRRALSGTPGPVYVEYDYSIHDKAWSFPPLIPPSRYRMGPQRADTVAIEGAARMIRAARSPLLVAGDDVVRTRSHDAFTRLARLIGVPVLMTMGGSGAVPETDAQVLLPMSEAGRSAIAGADLVVAIGTCFPEMSGYGRLSHFAEGDADRKVIVLERDAGAVGINRPVDLAVIGHLALTIAQLADEIEKQGPLQPQAGLPALRASYLSERERLEAEIPLTNRIHPSRLMLEARKAVPDDAVVVLDGGLTILYKMAFFEQRSRDFLYTSTFSHLGTGLGYAIGAQLAAGRERPVCLLSGDGALGFHFMEFETLVRHKLPVVVVVNDDQCLGAEMAAHVAHVGHTIETTFSPVRYDLMAVAIGGHGEYVDDAGEIGPAIARAFASGKPALVQVATDQSASHAHAPPYVMDLVGWLEADPATYSATIVPVIDEEPRR